MEMKLRYFQTNKNLRKFATSSLEFKKMLKGVVERKENDPRHKERNAEMNKEQNKG